MHSMQLKHVYVFILGFIYFFAVVFRCLLDLTEEKKTTVILRTMTINSTF